MTNLAEQIDPHAQWLRERKEGIGASECAAILSLDPFSSPMEVWLHKTNRIAPKEETLAMWLGHQMEPVISKRYEMETGRILHDPGEYTIIKHPEHPWLRSTLDRTTTYEDGRRGPVELKAPGQRMEGEWSHDKAPLNYEVQWQIQAACMGAEVGEIAAIVGNSDFYAIPQVANPDFIASIIPVLKAFWDCVENDTPPEIDGSEATEKALRKLHPHDNGKAIELDRDLITRWHEADAEEKEAVKATRLCKNRIISALGDNTFGAINGKYVVSFKASERTDNDGITKVTRTLRRIK